MRSACRSLFFLAVAVTLAGSVQAQETASTTEKKPYHVAEDGTVSWPVFSGFRRYNSVCHTCHGPDGVGSTFAPALVDSMKRLSYEQYMDVVVNGRKNVNTAVQRTMPSFGLDPNVMCYIDDIYAYLKARSDGVVPRGRPAKKEDKPAEWAEAEAACMGL